ncbi:uncharacterized protein LOC110700545 [Chenopodium quinoa]|uniref:SHSP domain-containing protein n=1 Tax=Chenopodium quinoa TaxID=63459 RepID=A0A803L923_CHEQI|nr:uncharacterized protein LOC110700545 [Chenopodium quinoa]
MADFTRRRWTTPKMAVPLRGPVDEEINPPSGWINEFRFHCLLVVLPGFEKGDIKLNVDESGIIEVTGRRKVNDEKQEHFKKTFNVPEDGDVKNIELIFDDGTLRVRIPGMVEEINPSSRWTDEFPGFHCLLINDLLGFNEDDIKLNVDKRGIIVVSGRRKSAGLKHEIFEKKFNVPIDGYTIHVNNIQKKFNGATTLKVFIPRPVEEEIIPSSRWTNDIPGSHCLLVNLPDFKRDDMEVEVDESGVIVVGGRRQVGGRKQEHFIKAFYVPGDRDMKSVKQTFEGDMLRVCIPKVAATEKGKPSTNKDKKESNIIPDENPASSSGVMDKGNEQVSSSTGVVDKGKEQVSSSSELMDKGKEASLRNNTMVEKGKEVSSNSEIMDKGKEQGSSSNNIMDKGKEQVSSSSELMDKGKEASSSNNTMVEKGKEVSSNSEIMDKGKEQGSSSNNIMDKGKEQVSSSSELMDKGKEASSSNNTMVEKGKEVSSNSEIMDKGKDQGS